MLSTLQFQSAHSAGSTYRSTAVCALQVLLVYPSLLTHQPVYTWRWNSSGFTASFVGLLSACASLCCANPCKALCYSGTQPKKERGARETVQKKHFPYNQPSRCRPPPHPHPACWRHVEATQLSFFASPVCLAVFRWMTSQFRYLTKWKEIAQYPSAIRQMLRATARSSDMRGSVRQLENLGEHLHLAPAWCSVNTRCHHLYVFGCAEPSRSNLRCQLTIRKSAQSQTPILCQLGRIIIIVIKARGDVMLMCVEFIWFLELPLTSCCLFE